MEKKLIEANAFLQRLQKKRYPGCASYKFTDGFNDAIMRVRSMVHSEPAVDLDCLPIVERLREDKERFRVLSENLAASNRDLIVVSKQAQEEAKEAKNAREESEANEKAVKDKCKSLQRRNKVLKAQYSRLVANLHHYLLVSGDDRHVYVPTSVVRGWLDDWDNLRGGGD